MAAGLYATATGANAVITVPASTTGRAVVLGPVAASYSGASTNGRITYASTGITTLDLDIDQAGARVLPSGFKGAPGQTVVITLYSGGGAVVGKLNLLSYWYE